MLSRLLGVRIFDIEASSRCNVRCKFCPRDVLPETGLMSRETFLRLLHGVQPGATDSFSFVGIGEPLLNPLLPYFLLEAKAWYPKVRTWVTTNATLLTVEKAQVLLDARLDTLDVSFNGTDAATYEDLVRGARFARTLANVAAAAELIRRTNSPTRLQINFILTEENADREAEIQAFWRARGVERFRVQHMHNRAGSVRVDGMTEPDRPGLGGACQIFGNFHFISWRGDALYCCHDMRRDLRVGNVNEEPWAKIMERKRRISREGRWPAFCAACTDPQRNNLVRYLDRQVWREARLMLASGLLRRGRRAIKVVAPPSPTEEKEVAAVTHRVGCQVCPPVNQAAEAHFAGTRN